MESPTVAACGASEDDDEDDDDDGILADESAGSFSSTACDINAAYFDVRHRRRKVGVVLHEQSCSQH